MNQEAEVEALVRTYLQVWNATDPDSRRSALEAAWAESGTYVDPNRRLQGRAGFEEFLPAFHERVPGARFELTSRVDHHGPHLRFAWRMLGGDGQELLRGTDIGRVGDDGRLASILGFFGDL
jgi:hypothetical protein